MALSPSQIAAVASGAGFSGDSLVISIAVALAESSGNPLVINYLGCVGLWQIYQSVHQPAHPTWTTRWLQNPANNATAAYALSSGGRNWQPWETFTNGMYLDHLGVAAAAAGAPDGTGVPTGEGSGGWSGPPIGWAGSGPRLDVSTPNLVAALDRSEVNFDPV
jgi:hypothetical protein